MKRKSRGIHTLSFLPLLLLLAVLPLQDTRAASAENSYNHARILFLSGYLALSQQEAESGFLKYRASDPAWAAKFQLLEANSMLYRGMYEGSLHLLSTYPEGSSTDGAVEKLAIETVALTRQERVTEAKQLLTRAESICRSSDFPSCGDVFTVHAILALRFGRLGEAKQSFLQALSFARIHRNQWLEASSSSNLGFIALQVDHFDEAVDWLRSAHNAAKSMGYENIAQAAAGNLGWAYYQLGDDERALEQFLAAEKAAAELGNVRYQLKWLSTAGYVYKDSGDWPRASQAYRQALLLARQIDSREDIENALKDLAYLSEDRDDLSGASKYIDQINSMGNEADRPDPTLALAMGRLAEKQNQFSQSEQYFRLIQNDPASLVTTRLSAGFELAMLFESQNDINAAEQMYKDILSMYVTARAQLKSEESQLPFGTNAAEIYDHYVHFLVHQGKTEAALEVADQSRAQTLEQSLQEPAARKRLQFATLNPQQVARKTNSTLLFYWLGEKESYLWVIAPAKTQLYVLPPEREIRETVQRYNRAILDVKDPLEDGSADGESLYKTLVSPAAALLRPNTQVILLTDGILSELNFETLLVPGAAGGAGPGGLPNAASNVQMHYLIDDLTVSSAPSLAMLVAAGPASQAAERILVMGNPISPDRDFPSLPLFGLEMSRIESHFSSVETSALAGQQATPAGYFASDPRNYTYIHFVSHAVASRTSPLDSAIILSNPAGHEDAYKLYAREIIQHRINAKLVTISACYGSGTRAYAGEGLVGLSWAFLHAGAQRVIGALWEVSDDSTPRLMDKLYERLTAGDTPAVALRDAKLSLLHSQSRFRAPYYWAPFQIYSRR